MTGLPADVPFVAAAPAAALRAAALLAALWVIRTGCGVGSRQLDSPATACTIPPSEDGTSAAPTFARNVPPFGIAKLPILVLNAFSASPTVPAAEISIRSPAAVRPVKPLLLR